MIKIFKMAAVDANNFRFQFGSAHFLRRSKSVNVPNFVKISESTAES